MWGGVGVCGGVSVCVWGCRCVCHGQRGHPRLHELQGTAVCAFLNVLFPLIHLKQNGNLFQIVPPENIKLDLN